MKVMKILRVLVLLLLVAVIGLYFVKDGFVRSAVEAAGSEALGVETTLDKCAVALFGGKVDAASLRVANPEGFSKDALLSVGGLQIGAGWKSLMGDPAAVEAITISDLDLLIEQEGASSNVQKLMDNVLKGKKEPAEPTQKDEKKFIVRRIEFTNLKVRAKLDVLGSLTQDLSFTVPKIIIKNLGADDGQGMTAPEIGTLIYKTLMDAVMKNGAGILPSDLLGGLSAQLGELGKLGDFGVDQVGSVVKNLEGLGKEADKVGKNLGKEAKKVGDQLKGLIGGGKKK